LARHHFAFGDVEKERRRDQGNRDPIAALRIRKEYIRVNDCISLLIVDSLYQELISYLVHQLNTFIVLIKDTFFLGQDDLLAF